MTVFDEVYEKNKENPIQEVTENSFPEDMLILEEKSVGEINPFENKGVKTFRDKQKSEILDLRAFKQSEKLLTGAVQSIEYLKNGTSKFDIQLVVLYGETGIPIHIPVEEFLLGIPESEIERFAGSNETQTPREWADRMAKSYLSAPIDYIVTSIENFDSVNPIVTGSRIKGMRIKQRIWYFNANSNKNIEVGKNVLSRIVCVRNNSVIMDVAGVETSLTAVDMGYQFISNLREAYKIGECYYVRVMELERNNDAKLVTDLKVSKKAADGDDRLLRMSRFTIGSTHKGYVTFIDEKGIVVSFYNESKMRGLNVPLAKHWIMDCRCSFPKGFERPVVGMKVFVHISKIDIEKKRLYGYIETFAYAG